ncbi:MAG: flippase-like domain-containing protein [Vicinamibacterales bacterium]
MTPSIPQIVSLAAVVIGASLFLVTLFYIDLDETIATASKLGLALPLVLVPGTCWQLLRTWGWAVAFPDDSRPSFSRLFRVRLAADAISFFTFRGIAGEPLKVLLLFDRSAPRVTTAAVALERLAFAVMGIVVAGLVSYVAPRRIAMPGAWEAVFTLLSMGAVIIVGSLALLARRRTGDYLGRFVSMLQRATGRQLEASRVVRFILDVEDIMLELLRGDRRRLLILSALPVVCYLIMTLEIWLVFWAVGSPIGLTPALAVETFTRLTSIASALIPANLGALEASNAAVATGLGLSGGGALVLARRIRSLLWAVIGLALYPARIGQASEKRRAPGPSRLRL